MRYPRIPNATDTGAGNILLRSLLGLLFLYLNFATYQLLGIGGVILTSAFFLVVQFSPLFLHFLTRRKQAKVSSLAVTLATPDNVDQCSRDSRLRLVGGTEQKAAATVNTPTSAETNRSAQILCPNSRTPTPWIKRNSGSGRLGSS